MLFLELLVFGCVDEGVDAAVGENEHDTGVVVSCNAHALYAKYLAILLEL